MASREIVVSECDFCGKTEDQVIITTHTMSVDGQEYEFESCDADWDRKILRVIASVSKVGRPVKRKRAPRKKATPVMADAYAFPNSNWQFTSHALQRMGERKIPPMKAIEVVEQPTNTRPGDDGSTVYWKGRLQAVANPTIGVIVTVAKRDEELV